MVTGGISHLLRVAVLLALAAPQEASTVDADDAEACLFHLRRAQNTDLALRMADCRDQPGSPVISFAAAVGTVREHNGGGDPLAFCRVQNDARGERRGRRRYR